MDLPWIYYGSATYTLRMNNLRKVQKEVVDNLEAPIFQIEAFLRWLKIITRFKVFWIIFILKYLIGEILETISIAGKQLSGSKITY